LIDAKARRDHMLRLTQSVAAPNVNGIFER
jgi:hypothetical protein